MTTVPATLPHSAVWSDTADLWAAATAILPAVWHTNVSVVRATDDDACRPRVTVAAIVSGIYPTTELSRDYASSLSWSANLVAADRTVFTVSADLPDTGRAVARLLGLLGEAATVGAHGDDAPTEVVSQ